MTYLITKPSLPPIEDYQKRISAIWQSRMLSNFSTNATEMQQIASDYTQNPLVTIVVSADIGLIIALSSLDLSPGSEVILPSFTFNSTANAVIWNNLTPVFADIDPSSLCLSLSDLESKISSKTRVIMATHVFGNPCRIKEINEIAHKHNLVTVYDSAHAYGSRYHGKTIGSFGDIDVFSFSGTKVVTSAEGGIIATTLPKIHQRLQYLTNYGFKEDYNSRFLGLNGKISELNAALGCLTLPTIETFVTKRQKIVDIYKKQLSNVGDLTFQLVDPQDRSTHKDFCILTSKRDNLADYLYTKDIYTKKYFRPIHLMDFFKKYHSALPNTEKITSTCLCLPIFNEMTEEDVSFIAQKIYNFYGNK